MEQIKKELGFLIEYYRQQYFLKTNSKEFAKETFPTIMINHQQLSICSTTTYRKLSNQEVLKSNTIYESLLHKLHLVYNENSFIYTKSFRIQCRKLLLAFEQVDYDSIIKISEHLLSQCRTNDLIEIEYKIVFEALKEMASHRHMLYDEEIMAEIVMKFIIYNEDIKQCLEIAIYNYCVLKQQSEKILYYFSLIKNTPYHRVHYLYYCIDDGYHLDFVKNELEELLLHYETHKNYAQVLNLLTMKMKYFFQIGRERDDAVEEIDQYILQHQKDVNISLIYAYWYYKAKMYCREKNYKQAKRQIEILIENDKTYLSIMSSYYFHCLIMLDETFDYHYEYEFLFNPKDLKIYQYFQIPKENHKQREDYIIKTLCNQQLLKQEFNNQSFLMELRKLVKVTKHYVLLEKYLQKTDDFL